MKLPAINTILLTTSIYGRAFRYCIHQVACDARAQEVEVSAGHAGSLRPSCSARPCTSPVIAVRESNAMSCQKFTLITAPPSSERWLTCQA